METSSSEKPLTWNMVTATTKLSKLQIRNIFKSRGVTLPAPETQIDEDSLMILLVAGLLETIPFLDPEQRVLVLDSIEPALAMAVRNTALAQVAFADRRYCMWTGNTGVLDLTTGDNLTSTPALPVETISYNLNAVYMYGRLKIERRSGLHGQRQNSDGTVEESADVCERSTDGVS